MCADINQSLPTPTGSSQPDPVVLTSSGSSQTDQSAPLAASGVKPVKASPTRPSVEQSIIADLRLSRDSMARQLSALSATNNLLTSFLVTKTHRIKKTNSVATEIYRNLHQFVEVEQLLNSDELLTVADIQEILSPLLAKWAQASDEKEMFFYKTNVCKINKKLPRARPMFQLSNLIQYLTPSEKKHSYYVSDKLPDLIFLVDTELHQDVPQLRYLRDGHGFNTIWESYLTIAATIFTFNILKQHPVRYATPYPFPAVLDYDNKQLYTEAMKNNRADLDLTKNPPAIREAEFFRIQPLQTSSPAPATQPSGSKRRRN